MNNRYMSRRRAVAAVALLAGGGAALQAAPAVAQGMDQTGGTTRFVRIAAVVSEFMIASGRLALQRSANPGIRGFAERMVKEHADILTSLKFTNDSNASARMPRGLDRDSQLMVDRLAATSGPDFDVLYMDMQVHTLEDVVVIYRQYSRVGSVDSLKKFAVKWMPMLEQHSQQARTVRGSLGA
jgi:putative membrane protein